MFTPLSTVARLGIVAFAIVILGLPLVVQAPYILHLLILSMLFALLSCSWNLITGWAGLKTFGHQAFFAIGAYVSALVAKDAHLTPWLTIWLGGLAASVFGLIVALPVLRIRSMPHVAIVTLGFAEIVRVVISNLKDVTRGELGLWGIPAFTGFHLPGYGDVVFNAAVKVPYYYTMAVLFLGGLGILGLFVRSRIGLAIVAMRDAQDAAESLGVNLTRHKLAVFSLGAFIAGVCGAFYAHYILLLTPDAVADLDVMILILSMTLVGGLGTFFGPVAGAFVLTLGVESLRGLGDYRMLIYGAGILAIVLVLPKGLSSIADLATGWRRPIARPVAADRPSG